LNLEQVEHARRLNADGRPVAEISGLLGVHRSTLYRALSKG
jgi:DNA invertase Pin-like site-specific DNA recombinase